MMDESQIKEESGDWLHELAFNNSSFGSLELLHDNIRNDKYQ